MLYSTGEQVLKIVSTGKGKTPFKRELKLPKYTGVREGGDVEPTTYVS